MARRRWRPGKRAGLLLLGSLFGLLLSGVPSPAFASTTTFSVTCAMLNSATPQATLAVAISGGTGTSVAPGTALCDGAAHTITVTYTVLTGAQTTITEPGDTGTLHYRYSDGNTVETNTCTSNSCPAFNVQNYLDLSNTYAMNPVSPPAWDYAYSEPVYGYQLGVFGTIAAVSLSNGGGTASASGFADYNTNVCFVDSFASQTAGSNWGIGQTGAVPQCNKFTTGGNTKTEKYIIQAAVNPTIPNVALGQDWYQGLTETAGGVLALGRDWYQGLTETFGTLGLGQGHTSAPVPTIFLVCGNHTANMPLCAIQPMQFSPLAGTTPQTVTISQCNPSPATVLGDGNVYNVEMGVSCQFIATLPSGYEWVTTGSSAIYYTSCAGGACSTFSANYVTVTSFAVTLTVDNPSQPIGGTAHFTATATLSLFDGYQLLIFDVTNSTTSALATCNSSPCALSVTSHHSNTQTFEAAVATTGTLGGAVSTSNQVPVQWSPYFCTNCNGPPAGESFIYVKATFQGGTPSSYPQFTYHYHGSQHSVVLSAVYQNVTVDTGTLWSVPSPYFSNLVNWYTNPKSGFIASGWPYGNNYNFDYAQAPACQNTGNAWTDMLNRCYFQAFYDLYQPTIGGANAIGLVLAVMDTALYFKNKHVLMAVVILMVEAVIFVGAAGFGLPNWLTPIGWTILTLSLTAVVWSFVTRRK